MIGVPGPSTDSTIQGYNTFGSAQPFRLDEANSRKSAPAASWRGRSQFFCSNLCHLFRFYLSGGTPGREMGHPVSRAPYLSRDTAG